MQNPSTLLTCVSCSLHVSATPFSICDLWSPDCLWQQGAINFHDDHKSGRIVLLILFCCARFSFCWLALSSPQVLWRLCVHPSCFLILSYSPVSETSCFCSFILYSHMCLSALQRTYWNAAVIDFIVMWTLPCFVNPSLPSINPSFIWKIYTRSFFLNHLSFSIILIVLTCLTPRPLSPFTKWRRGSSHQM